MIVKEKTKETYLTSVLSSRFRNEDVDSGVWMVMLNEKRTQYRIGADLDYDDNIIILGTTEFPFWMKIQIQTDTKLVALSFHWD